MRQQSMRANTRQGGLNILELMLVLLILSILLVISIPIYRQYTARTQVTEGLYLASPVLLRAVEYWQGQGTWPPNNIAAGVAPKDDFATDIVQSIEVKPTGGSNPVSEVIITYKTTSGGIPALGVNNTIIYTPVVEPGSRTVSWVCTGGTLESWARPNRCR